MSNELTDERKRRIDERIDEIEAFKQNDYENVDSVFYCEECGWYDITAPMDSPEYPNRYITVCGECGEPGPTTRDLDEIIGESN